MLRRKTHMPDCESLKGKPNSARLAPVSSMLPTRCEGFIAWPAACWQALRW